jgi:hypothetical protein
MPAMLASICGGRQQRALVGAEGRIAHLGRAAAHQRDRLVPGLLQPAQHHDLDQAAHMQRLRRRVEADIGRHDARDQRLVEPLQSVQSARKPRAIITRRSRIWAGRS